VINVRALGGHPVPIGVVGDDDAGRRLTSLLADAGVDTTGVSTLAGYATPIKTRVLAGLLHSRAQQVIRIDRGSALRGPPATAAAAAERARSLMDRGIKALMISDYGYDLVTPESALPLVEAARRLKVTVACDSRRRLAKFRGVTAVTPNLEEAE